MIITYSAGQGIMLSFQMRMYHSELLSMYLNSKMLLVRKKTKILHTVVTGHSKLRNK